MALEQKTTVVPFKIHPGIKKPKQDNEVQEVIKSFLNRIERRSKNTRDKYERDIRDFFMFVRGKELEELTIDDLKIKNKDVLDFQEELIKLKKYKNSTINNKITGIISLFNMLKANEFDVNPKALSVDRLPDDTKSIGYLTPEEVYELANAAHTEKRNPHMKRCLIIAALVTSLRVSALISLKYKDFIQDARDPDKYIIDNGKHDKNKRIYKEIHRSFYEELLKIKPDHKPDDRVFNISRRGALDMLERLCKVVGIDERRNISFHSIRKASVEYVRDLTNGDVFAMTAQGNWSDPKLVMSTYLRPEANVLGMAAFEDNDNEIFDQLTHEEAIELLKRFSENNGSGVRLRREAKKIVEGRHVE